MHSALEAPNHLDHHVPEEASLLIVLMVLDAAVAANMLALAQLLALFLVNEKRCSESSFCAISKSLVLTKLSSGAPTCNAKDPYKLTTTHKT
jgi:hypothetical protein